MCVTANADRADPEKGYNLKHTEPKTPSSFEAIFSSYKNKNKWMSLQSELITAIAKFAKFLFDLYFNFGGNSI